MSNAVATRTVVQLVPQYEREFSELLPDHIEAHTFVRLAQAALRRNKALSEAAERDPASLVFALREAARLGHEPGTDAFWLVPLGGKVEGWEGYRGVVERMYRAGATASVVAEVVRVGDVFEWLPGTMNKPRHEVDWFGERGEIIGAYAYANLTTGSTSKVVVVNRAYIDKIRKESRGSSRADSPWNKWEEAMILKTAVHRLEPWVPTSSRYITERLRAVKAAEVEGPLPAPPAHIPAPPTEFPPPHVDEETGEVYEAEIVEEASS